MSIAMDCLSDMTGSRDALYFMGSKLAGVPTPQKKPLRRYKLGGHEKSGFSETNWLSCY